jgi:hypothetical protein
MSDRTPISWVEAEPERMAAERGAMAVTAPDLTWRDDLLWPGGRLAYGWLGQAPVWAADRPKPPGIDELLDGRRLEVAVLYPEAFPAVPPALFPQDPKIPLERRTQHRWHVNGDGSLCLMQTVDDWQLTATAADLVRKASGWFIEYLLVDREEVEAMTERGIFLDTSLDDMLAKLAAS